MEWHDRELPKFFSDLIGDLRDEVWRLKGEGFVAGTEEFTRGNVAMLVDPVAGNVAIQTLQDQLKMQNEEINALKGKNMNVLLVFVVFVIGLVVGKLLLN